MSFKVLMAVNIPNVFLRFLTACIFRGIYTYFHPQVEKPGTEGGRRLFKKVFDRGTTRSH